jgi:hypothetical protein
VRHIAFGDLEGHVDAISFERRHGGDDLRGVQALAEVLALDLLLRAVDEGLVERQTLADAGVLSGP